MEDLARRFTMSELQSILIFLQFGNGISELIREIENPNSNFLNPNCRGKFINMLSRLRGINAEEECILRSFSNTICEPSIMDALRPLYPNAR